MDSNEFRINEFSSDVNTLIEMARKHVKANAGEWKPSMVPHGIRVVGVRGDRIVCATFQIVDEVRRIP